MRGRVAAFTARYRLEVLAFAAVLFASCNSTGPETEPPDLVARIAIDNQFPDLVLRDSLRLTALAFDSLDGAMPAPVVSWTSSNPAVATVAPTGWLRAVGAGTSIIRARHGNVTDSVLALVSATRNREISYADDAFRTPHSVNELWLVRDDGSGGRRLSSDGQSVHSFAWSPDGSRLVVPYWLTTTQHVPLTEIVDVVSGARDSLPFQALFPSVAPDQDLIVFSYATGLTSQTFGIYTTRVSDHVFRPLFDLPGADLQPRWSPDGNHIAFLNNPGPDVFELWLANADGSGPRRVAPIARNHYWSPDGQSILFDDWDRVWIVPVATGISRAITPSIGNSCCIDLGLGFARWSPDGTMVVYSLGGDLRVIRTDGTLVHEVQVAGSGVFAPDGNHISFIRRNSEGWSSVNISRLDGTGSRFLSSRQNASVPLWRP